MKENRKDLREQVRDQRKEAEARARGRALMEYHRKLALETQRVAKGKL